MTDTRATLTADEKDDLDDSDFAYIDKDGDRHLPVHDAAHVKAALSRFGQTQFDSDDDKPAAAKKIVAAAKKVGVGVSADSTVGKAAGLKADVEKKSRVAPPTAEQRAEESLSFGDIQSAVYEALMGTLPGRPDVWIMDLGSDWVVYQDYWADGMFKVGYSMDADNFVTFDGDPVRVDQVTSFVPVEQQNGSEPEGEHRADAGTCNRCGGDKTVNVNGSDVKCPQCGGSGTGENNAEEKSARRPSRRRQRRDLPRRSERRLFTAPIEVRSAEVEGDEVVLTGLPIRYDTPYDVRDAFGTFRETMRPGVVDGVLSRDIDCRFLENHTGRPMARTANGTLTLTSTPDGLACEARVDTRRTDSRDLALAVERGDVTQMSCGFVVAAEGDEWRWTDDGVEERDVFQLDELFDVSAVTYPASPTTSIELAQRALNGLDSETRARVRKLWAIAKDLREGKVLSQQNGQELMEALEALHEADDVDLPGIVEQLQVVDRALDKGQGALSNVLGRANPDGDPADQEPALVPPPAGERSEDLITIQRQRLQIVKARLA